MRKSKVLKKLRAGEPVFCLKSSYAVPEIVELMGLLGTDVVWICNEHNELGAETVRSIMRAGKAADTDILFRRAFSSYDRLIQVLEAGTTGLMIPHCKNADMAREIVRECKFAPVGRRGFDGINADSDFGTGSLMEYLHHANEETFVMVQVEDAEAVDEIEKIAEVPGVDIIYIGPADLSQSLGIYVEFKHPEIQKIIRRTVAACHRNNKYCGTSGLDCEYMDFLLSEGVDFITFKSDYGMIKEGVKNALRDIGKLVVRHNAAQVLETESSGVKL